ncbi:MAG TPA: hypothetical protein VLY63_13560, partial [Anaerolineae bacterium]|nr:hypothetical protein [Anaerolineae bacterium]
ASDRQRVLRIITEELLDYFMREMTDPGGECYSTQDADSEGVEGKFFIWTPNEIREVLGSEAVMVQYPLGFLHWLQALAYTPSKPREIAIVSEPNAADTQALQDVVRDGYQRFQVVALGAPDSGNTADGVGSIAAVPLLQDRGFVGGQAAAYVCDAPVPGRAFACRASVTGPQALKELFGLR